ncbi:ABC transporter substrate-binding protein [Teredinibacter sp. KSP-S5-2]|uniref:ABC transporter substrate-binding protein n=1 Tax=Teredinibacter sp. KSP-S5-2 TaxID=3034506 RepID=UPI0029351017|nr:ABC transporter substrate-binding protein [Teredinibacter sp. KSP-S5-2]WNO08266.1 ABC transporter substrate-binding protein [Teredinibacter sp. KSP-S5-2]
MPFKALLVLTFTVLILTGNIARGDQDLSVRLKWFHSYQFAGYYAAYEKGFYADAGLNVTLKERDPKTTPADDVISGRDDFGVADSSIILRRLNGDPVVMLAVIFQSSPLILMTLAEKNLTSPLDLKGKKVMYQKDIDDALITAVFNEVGMSEQDFIHVPHNFDNDALLTGYADAMSAYISNQPFLYRKKGIAVNIISPSNYGIDFYGDNLFTSEAYIRKHPNITLKFREATLKGWEYALEHPDEVYDWLTEKYAPDAYTSREQFDYEVLTIRRMIKPRLHHIGDMNESRFQRLAEIYQEKGLVYGDGNISKLHYMHYYASEQESRLKLIILLGLTLIAILTALFFLINYKLKKVIEHKTQELIKANSVKNNFLASMSHELRTPLNSIIGYSSRLIKILGPDLEDKHNRALRAINNSGHHLLEMVNDLLDIEKIESGQMELNICPCDLESQISKAVNSVSILADEKGIYIKKPDKYPLETFDADPVRLTEIILNLLSNAIKYSSDGCITIDCSLTEQNGLEMLAIAITDQGIGIHATDIPKLFTRFRQFDEKSKNIKGHGTGLGLALVMELSKLHNGSVTCESTLGEGSTFTVTLPIKQDVKTQ